MLEGDSGESTATSVGSERPSPDRMESPVASVQSMPSLMSLNVPPPPVLADASPLLPQLTALPVRRDGDPALQQLHILVISQPGAGSGVAQAASIHPYAAGTRENSWNALSEHLIFQEVISLLLACLNSFWVVYLFCILEFFF